MVPPIRGIGRATNPFYHSGKQMMDQGVLVSGTSKPPYDAILVFQPVHGLVWRSPRMLLCPNVLALEWICVERTVL